jgi:hypothetical protein
MLTYRYIPYIAYISSITRLPIHRRLDPSIRNVHPQATPQARLPATLGQRLRCNSLCGRVSQGCRCYEMLGLDSEDRKPSFDRWA